MRLALLIVLFSLSTHVFSYVDFSVNYSFNKRVFVDESIATDNDNMATSTSEGYSIIWAWYIWEYTALEFNYSQSKDKLVDERDATLDASITIKNVETVVLTQVSGVGIRQAFANRKARIIPAISIGYAKFVSSGSTTYTYDNAGTAAEFTQEQETVESGSGYATFQVRFRLTEFMGLTIAAKTVVPEFETSKAKNNMTYLAGFSWVF